MLTYFEYITRVMKISIREYNSLTYFEKNVIRKEFDNYKKENIKI